MSRRALTSPLMLTLTAGTALLAGACASRNDGTTTAGYDFGASPPDGGGTPIGPGTGGVATPTGGTETPSGGTPAPTGGTEAPTGGTALPMGGTPAPGGSVVPPEPDAGTGGTPAMGDPGPCAHRAPDAHGACPATIYEVRKEIGLGNRVTVQGVVTSVRAGNDGTPRNVTLQIGTEQDVYFGADFSAVWLYLGDATAGADQVGLLQLGQKVDVTGTTNDFHGQRQIIVVEAVTAEGAAHPVVPLPVDPADVATGGPRALALEAALVEVNDVTVTDAAPAPGEGDRDPTNEVELTGGLRLDDFFYRLEPLPAAGEPFPRIDGIVRLSNNLNKLEPRDATDVDRPHAPPPAADMGAPPPPADMGAPPPPADAGPPPPPAGGQLLISELDYDQMGADTMEFVEIYNPGDAAVALAGLNLELVNGADGMVYRRFALSDAGPGLASHGFLVVGAQALLATLPMGVPSIPFGDQPGLNQSIIQNGPDGVRIADAAGTRLDGVAYEGAIEGTGEGDPTTGDPGHAEGDSLSRCLNAPNHHDNATDFQVLTPTPGVTQSCP